MAQPQVIFIHCLYLAKLNTVHVLRIGAIAQHSPKRGRCATLRFYGKAAHSAAPSVRRLIAQ